MTLRAGSAPRPWEFLEVAGTLSEPRFWNSSWELFLHGVLQAWNTSKRGGDGRALSHPATSCQHI